MIDLLNEAALLLINCLYPISFVCHQGKYDEAVQMFDRCVVILEKSLGPDHPDVAHILNVRAELLRKQVRHVS